MTGDETHDRDSTASVESDRSPARTGQERPVPVLGAYDAVKGTDAFILAAADRDDAWIAVRAGGELSLGKWR